MGAASDIYLLLPDLCGWQQHNVRMEPLEPQRADGEDPSQAAGVYNSEIQSSSFYIFHSPWNLLEF